MVDPIHYIRKLTALLVVSGSLNIIFIVLGFYLAIKERPPTPYFELKPANKQEQQIPLATERSDSEVIRYFRRMPLEWLISRLNNTQLVENGYTQRDLALASLVAFHYFDLDRAFAGMSKPLEKRLIVYGQFRDGRSAELVVYPGISDKHFEAVCTFAATERWPLTNRGLFLALQKEEKEDYDSHLLDAFFMTSEFSTVEMLFSRSEQPIVREELLKVLLDGSWTQLSDFVEQQKKSQDLSPARRQTFLLDFAKNKSKAAAQLLLKTDGTFAAKKLDDQQVMLLLQLIDEKSPSSKQFALTLIKSPRSDVVRKLAAEWLSEYTGIAISDLYQRRDELFGHVPSDKKVTTVVPVKSGEIKQIKSLTMPTSTMPTSTMSTPPPAVAVRKVQPAVLQNKDFYYTVQEGDSLWKIGRRFSVDIEVLRAFNQLDSDVLRPGMRLRVPAKN